MYDIIDNIEEGRLPDNYKEVIIVDSFARRKNLQIGDKLHYKKFNRIEEFTVVGTYSLPKYELSKNIDYMYTIKPGSETKASSLKYVTQLYFELHDSKADQVEFTKYINENFPEPKFRQVLYGGNSDMLKEFVRSQDIIMAFIQIFISIVIFVIIASLTNYTISSKYHQIGILKAMGYKNRSIKRLFVLKTFIISIPAVGLGLLFNKIGLIIFQRIMTYDNGDKRINVLMNNDLTIITISIVMFVVLISTYYSLKQTSKINIIDIIKEN